MNRPAPRTMVTWATCAVLTIGGYVLLLAPGRSNINVLFILALLGVLAGAFRFGSSLGALSLVTLGGLLALQLPVEWLVAPLPVDIARQAHDVGWIGALTILIVALVMAIRQRPPTRLSDGTSVLESRLVTWIALLCVVGGPAFTVVTFGASSNDLSLRPAVFGLPVGLFGVVLFSGYWAFHTVSGRPRTAAILALAYPALLVAAANGSHWVVSTPAPQPAAVVENILPDGRVVRASAASPGQLPANALDGRANTAWHAARHPPAWIELDLVEPSTVAEIKLLVAQSPGGETTHQVIGVNSTGGEATLAEFRGVTQDGQWLIQALTPPAVDIRTVRITTLASPSWVAWSEIEVVTQVP